MAEAKLIPPKKKRRVHTQRESPFPVPIESVTDRPAGASSWFYYKGELLGDGVVVKNSGDINYLYKMGYFGKGTLSRSKPASGHRYIKTNVDGENKNLRVTERRTYIRHLNWQMQKATGTELPCDVELQEFTSSEEDSDTEMEAAKQNIIVDEKASNNSKLCDIENESKETTAISDYSSGSPKNATCDTYVLNDQFSQNKDTNWTNIEEDDGFWGSGENNVKENSDTTSVEKKQIDWMESADFWNESVPDVESRIHSAENVISPMDIAEITAEKLNQNSKCDQMGLHGDDLNSTEKVSDNSEQSENKSDASDNIETVHMNSSDECKYDDNTRPEKSDVSEKYEIVNDPKIVDPLCVEIEDNADLLVVEDEGSDEVEKKCKIWDPVRKRDPYKISEFLHLTLEEAFFLSYGIGCLVIPDNNGVPLDLTQLWQMFVEKKKTFLPNYVAYHHYRSTGWVPKSGLKYGTDFILYKDGPPFYHASYSVVVQLVSEDTLRVDPDYLMRHVTWTSLAGLNRMTEHVGKELMICYVIKPHDLCSDDLRSPACIPKFKVQEFVVSRWVPSQERERSEEIP